MCISLPGLVLEVDPSRAEALVEIGAAQQRVSTIALTLDGDTIGPGDWLLVNAGLALEHIDEEEAERYHAWLSDAEPDDLAGGDR